MTTMTISGKVSDLFGLSVHDDDNNEVVDYDGYVPNGIGIGGGDYLELEIDLETGKVKDWKPLTVEDVKDACDDA